ncbi:kinase-like protein [Hypoxylon sp. FL1857]|nr:kinase-like protein [Hypoxylon sp. FL1857]
MDARRTENMIFCLSGSNKRAQKALRHRYNAKWSSRQFFDERCLNFGSFSPPSRDDNPVITLATLGSSKRRADIYIKAEGNDIARVHCALVVNYKTGVFLVEDRSSGDTRVYQNPEGKTNRMPTSGDQRRVIVTKGFNTVLDMGKNPRKSVKFTFLWNMDPEQTLAVINRRLSGVSKNILKAGYVDFPSQMTFDRSEPIVHFPVNELGSGGYGRVWRTIDAHSGDIFAVKILNPPAFEGDPSWARRAKRSQLREVSYVRGLRHPNILPVLASQGWETGNLEIFVPLMQGSLWNLIYGRNMNPDVAEIAYPALVHALAAIDYLDLQGLVHRDIKPENILYRHDGKSYHFVVSDFGTLNYAEVAKTGIGTMMYFAPEINLKHLPQTSRVDVWSLFVSMLLIHDEVFRWEGTELAKNLIDLSRFIVNSALNNPKLRYIREMGIWDPKFRATAGQILVNLGRVDLISNPVTPLGEDHFERWLEHVRTSNDEYSNMYRGLVRSKRN